MTLKYLRPEIRWAVEAAQDKQAVDITVLRLTGVGAFAEYFLLCSGRSHPQIQAIGEAIEERLGQHGVRLAHREGKASAEWVLLDYGDFVAHIFSERAREYYRSRAALALGRAPGFSRARKAAGAAGGIRKRRGTIMSAANIVWVAADPASRTVLEVAEKLAPTATTLLITGESGTGKDQLARWIHERGPRRDAPFLKIDCASLPSELIESELFGHERGAFTGAVARKPGRLEMAQGGSIVLDEVAALTPAMQAKLLRVLEERTFERLGGTETLHMDARLMALTNTDLTGAVSSGRFREDLFFRLNVLGIFVPPLRERPADIAPLAAHFLARLGHVHGRADAALDPAALALLESYAWPGNARELKNAVEHALVFARDSVLRAEKFPEILRAVKKGPGAADALRSLEDIEREAIQATLEATRFKIGRAAEVLGISRKTLLDKRKKYGLI